MTTVAPSDTFSIGGDLPVHRLGYGAMQLPGPGVWGEPADPENARRVVRAAVEQGVDFIDTADSYGPVVSERIIAEALHPYPEGLVIATKAGLTRQGPGIWTPVGRPAYLKQQVELSLRSQALQDALMALAPRDRQVVVLRYGLDDAEPKTLEEIGRRLGLTRERVRQIEVEALRRLASLREMELAR